ncbi:hypothetical protein [Collinsella sp. HCP28S3_H5]|uniref:hypothetical protein n=1 Tax=Collinsella sp. HCP28S3_H5 TaxID=3438928 RepID=UPI003F8B038D
MIVELPKDAKGREIPLDTEVLYDKEGKLREVDWYTYYPDKDRWDVVFEDSCVRFSPNNLSLTPPDSWKKLEDDLGKIANNPGEVVCAYFGREISDCDGCKLESCECACSNAYLIDVIERIRKLRGED